MKFGGCIKKMNEDLDRFYDWLNYNKFCINVEKTKFMIVTHKKLNRDEFDLMIGNNKIGRVSEMKYLGVIIDQRLSFLPHLQYVKKKLYGKLALFR
jgi:hypothetical protein